jgi:ribosome-associated heat shock protein Hsp15
MTDETIDRRIDLWLKLVCLFKQRSDAADGVKGGHVKVNGQRVKPAYHVKPGDQIEISSPVFRRLVVLDIPRGSISKEVARTMYRDETPERPKLDLAAASGLPDRDRGMGRPTKRERRDIEKWRK